MEDKRRYGINIEFFSKEESYEPFNMNVKMNLCSDIGATEAIKAFLRLLECAGYGRIGYSTIESIALELKDEEDYIANLKK